MQRVIKISGWDYQSTPFRDIDRVFNIMQRIEILAQNREDPNVPIVILDWGCGDGRAVVELFRELQKREDAGRGIANVVVYGFADESYTKWNKAPKGTNFIWGTTEHLKDRLKQYLGKVSMIISNYGSEHVIEGNQVIFKRHFLDLHDLLGLKERGFTHDRHPALER